MFDAYVPFCDWMQNPLLPSIQMFIIGCIIHPTTLIGDYVIQYQGMDAALVVIDVQNKFYRVTEGLEASVDRHIGTMNDAMELFRSNGSPVIRVQFDGLNDCTANDIEDPEGFVPGLACADTDIIVHKGFMNSFRESELEKAIKDTGCRCMVLVGLVAHLCVLATYFRAFDIDLEPWILKGGIAATDEGNVDHVEAICRVVSLDDLRP